MTNFEKMEIARERKRSADRAKKNEALAKFNKVNDLLRPAKEAALTLEAAIEAKAIRTHRGFGVRTFRTGS